MSFIDQIKQRAKNEIRIDATKFREAAQKAWDKMSLERAGYNPAVVNFENQQQLNK